jgi:hypothetical protein
MKSLLNALIFGKESKGWVSQTLFLTKMKMPLMIRLLLIHKNYCKILRTKFSVFNQPRKDDIMCVTQPSR